MTQQELPELQSGFAGERLIRMPVALRSSARRAHRLLRGLLVTGAGYFPKARGHVRRRPAGCGEAVLLYCVAGGGWCEVFGRVQAIRVGDLVMLPSDEPHAYGSSQTEPWTLHWVHAVGEDLERYAEALRFRANCPVVSVGEDLQLVLLFSEILRAVQRGFAYHHMLCASTALAHLLALAACNVQEGRREAGDGLCKVAHCIEYMSEHLGETLRAGDLARLVGMSASHLTALFQELTGVSPRGYLHLLRMHQACRWLADTDRPVKAIAMDLGYRDQFHFSRSFRTFSGIPPSSYRRCQRLQLPKSSAH